MLDATTYPNFRTVAGQRAADGLRVRSGALYRSEALLAPDGEDSDVLASCGIALVCDLRSEFERKRAPNHWWDQRGVEHIHADLLAGFGRDSGSWPAFRQSPTAARAANAMCALYAALPRGAMDLWPTLFERIAAGQTPLLIHCTAGKDRTGFVVAVLLGALGVERRDILADYLDSAGKRTETVVDATRAMMRSFAGDELPEEAIGVLLSVDESYLDASLEVIEREFGGIAAYLETCGVGAAEQGAVRAALLG